MKTSESSLKQQQERDNEVRHLKRATRTPTARCKKPTTVTPSKLSLWQSRQDAAKAARAVSDMVPVMAMLSDLNESGCA
jgi:hypothetical protein